VWFTTDDDTSWRIGVSRTVSETGADIACDPPPRVSDPIRVVIALPSAGCLVGRGRVVRAQPSADAPGAAHFAVAIERFRIERRDAILDDCTPVLHECQQRW
jgi:hypothetical protein